MTDIWKTIESRLTEIYSLPHNKVFLADKGRTLDSTIQHKLNEIRSGINGVPKQVHGVVIGELLALAYEETVPLVTHPQLKRSRIVRH